MLVSSVAKEFARSKAEEIATAMPLFARTMVRVFLATAENRFDRNIEFVQGGNQVVLVFTVCFLSIDGDVEGLILAVLNNGFECHAPVNIQHGEHHIEVDE